MLIENLHKAYGEVNSAICKLHGTGREGIIDVLNEINTKLNELKCSLRDEASKAEEKMTPESAFRSASETASRSA